MLSPPGLEGGGHAGGVSGAGLLFVQESLWGSGQEALSRNCPEASSPVRACACMPSCFRRVQFCDRMDCSSPSSPVRGILQARILEWVAMPSSGGSSRPRDRTLLSYVTCIDWLALYLQHYLGNPVLLLCDSQFGTPHLFQMTSLEVLVMGQDSRWTLNPPECSGVGQTGRKQPFVLRI